MAALTPDLWDSAALPLLCPLWVWRTGGHLAGVMSSSRSVSPGMRAAWALTARALFWTRSWGAEENSWLVVIPRGAIPCSLKS